MPSPCKTAEVYKNNLDKDTVDGFVEAIKARIINEGLYGNESSNKALFTALLPM
jgi:hypothetical protein